MLNTLIMYTGAFVFLMLLIGVVLTVREFQAIREKKLTPEREAVNAIRSTQAPHSDNH